MEQAISSDLIRGHIDTIILHTLISGDKFAQQISDSIEEKSQKEYKINQATLYSSLKRLESLKYVQSYWNDSDNGRRKYFKLTVLGKTTVDTNLSNWSFSRSIIDKLMDCEPQPVFKTQIIEKIVEVEKPVLVNSNDKTEENVEIVENSALSSKKIDDKSIDDSESIQEINFRNVLNGLIKASAPTKKTDVQPLEPIERELNDDKNQPDVQKFNETISMIDYNAQKNNNGKIDFGDLTLKAIQEGYKIKISSKDSFVSKTNLLINKLRLNASLLTFIFGLLAYFLIFNVALRVVNPYLFVGTLTILLIYPSICLIKYISNPLQTASKKITTERILTASIVIFNVALITVALNLLFSVDFYNVNVIAFTLALPIVLSLIVIIYHAFELLLSKNKAFFKSKR